MSYGSARQIEGMPTAGKGERGEFASERGLAAWLLNRLRRRPRREPRLALLERIALAPRQSLALVEADGRHLLVATSPDGAPTFYALDGSGAVAVRRDHRKPANRAGRVSW